MTERVFSDSSLLQQIDNLSSRELSQEEFSALTDVNNKGGKVSLDDEGKIFVIRPEARRHNSFVRFFVGLFKGHDAKIAYQREQRALDRLEDFKQNAEFCSALQTVVAKYVMKNIASSNLGDMNSKFEYSRVVLGNLARFVQPKTEIKAGDLQQALDSSRRMTARQISRAVVLSSGKNQVSYDNIYYQGKTQGPREFVLMQKMEAEHQRELQAAQNAAPGTQEPAVKDGAQLLQWAEKQLTSEESVITGLNSYIMSNPDSVELFLDRQDIDRMCELLADPEGLKGDKGEEYSNLLSKAAANFYKKVGEVAQQRIEQGDDPKDVATSVATMLSICGRSQSPADFVQNIQAAMTVTPPVVTDGQNPNDVNELQTRAAVRTASLQPEVSVQTAIDKIKQLAQSFKVSVPIDDKTASRIVNFCEKMRVMPEFFMKSVAELSELLAEINTTGPSQINEKISELAEKVRESAKESKKATHPNEPNYVPSPEVQDYSNTLKCAMVFLGFTAGAQSLQRLFRLSDCLENASSLLFGLASEDSKSDAYQAACSVAGGQLVPLCSAVKDAQVNILGNAPVLNEHETFDSMSVQERELTVSLVSKLYLQTREANNLISLCRTGLAENELRVFDEEIADIPNNLRRLSPEQFENLGITAEDVAKSRIPSDLSAAGDQSAYVDDLEFDSVMARAIKDARDKAIFVVRG